MSAKGKLVMALGGILLLAGAAIYFGARHLAKERNRHQTQAHEAPVLQQQERATANMRESVDSISTSPTDKTPFLYGRVTDGEGWPLAGVTVEAGVFEGASVHSLREKMSVESTETDAEGWFGFREGEAFSAARQSLRSTDQSPQRTLHSLMVASRVGYFPSRQEVSLGIQTGPHQMVLKEVPGITGMVFWEESLEPVCGARVVCALAEERIDIYECVEAECRTGEQGNFSLDLCGSGEAVVTAGLEWRHRVRSVPTRTVELVPGETIDNLILPIERGAATIIEGRVLDVRGGPVARAMVQLSTDRGRSETVVSGDDGAYRMVVPKVWPYQSYFLDDWQEKPGVIFKSAGGRWEVSTPNSYCIFSGSYEDWVKVLEDRILGDTQEEALLWTPPSHAPPERLLAFHPDYGIGVVDVPVLGPGQMRRDVDIVLHEESRVSGKVTDDNSLPVPGAKIALKILDDRVHPLTGRRIETKKAESGSGAALIKNDERIIRRQEILTGEDGTFDIRFLREGRYELTASLEDFDPQTRQLELQPHEVVEGFDFLLVERTGTIRGRVVDQAGNPWPHGRIKTHIRYRVGFITTRVADVKEDGTYELSGLSLREHDKYNLWLEVTKDYPGPEGILEASGLKAVPVDAEGADIVMREAPAGALRVRVVNQSQQPIEEFTLKCRSLSVPYRACGITDEKYSGMHHLDRRIVSESGESLVEKVIPGTYRVTVTAREHGTKSAEVEIGDREETEVPFVLEELGDM